MATNRERHMEQPLPFGQWLLTQKDKPGLITELIVSTIGGKVIISIATLKGASATVKDRNEGLPMPDHMKELINIGKNLFKGILYDGGTLETRMPLVMLDALPSGQAIFNTADILKITFEYGSPEIVLRGVGEAIRLPHESVADVAAATDNPENRVIKTTSQA